MSEESKKESIIECESDISQGLEVRRTNSLEQKSEEKVFLDPECGEWKPYVDIEERVNVENIEEINELVDKMYEEEPKLMKSLADLDAKCDAERDSRIESSTEDELVQAKKVAESLARDIYILCENTLQVLSTGSFRIEDAGDAFHLQVMCEGYKERLVVNPANEVQSTESADAKD